MNLTIFKNGLLLYFNKICNVSKPEYDWAVENERTLGDQNCQGKISQTSPAALSPNSPVKKHKNGFTIHNYSGSITITDIAGKQIFQGQVQPGVINKVNLPEKAVFKVGDKAFIK